MAALKNILTLQLAEAGNLGGALSPALRSALASYRERLFYAALALSAVVVLLIGFSAYLIAMHVAEPGRLAIFSTALGCTAGGGVELLRRLWAEWSRTGLLALLVEGSPEAVIASVVTALVAKL